MGEFLPPHGLVVRLVGQKILTQTNRCHYDGIHIEHSFNDLTMWLLLCGKLLEATASFLFVFDVSHYHHLHETIFRAISSPDDDGVK